MCNLTILHGRLLSPNLRKDYFFKNGAEHETTGTQTYKNDICPSLVAITYCNVSCFNHSVRHLYQVPYGTAQQEKMPALSPRTFTSPSVSSLHFALKKMHFFTKYRRCYTGTTFKGNRANLGLRIHIVVSLRIRLRIHCGSGYESGSSNRKKFSKS